MATEEEPRGEGCQVMVAERPQLLVTNLMVASVMLSCPWRPRIGRRRRPFGRNRPKESSEMAGVGPKYQANKPGSSQAT
jgi:hypothetical protein